MLTVLAMSLLGCQSNTDSDIDVKEFITLESFQSDYDWMYGNMSLNESTWSFHTFIVDPYPEINDTNRLFLSDFRVSFDIQEVNDEEQYVLGSVTNGNTEQWIKFAWTIQDDMKFLCVTPASVDPDTALAHPIDLDDVRYGCNGTVWYELRDKIELSGLFQYEVYDWYVIGVNSFEWLAYFEDTSLSYESFVVSDVDREKNILKGMMENLEYRQVQWTKGEGDSWYLCVPNEVQTLTELENYPESDPNDLYDGCVYADNSRGSWKRFHPYEE